MVDIIASLFGIWLVLAVVGGCVYHTSKDAQGDDFNLVIFFLCAIFALPLGIYLLARYGLPAVAIRLFADIKKLFPEKRAISELRSPRELGLYD